MPVILCDRWDREGGGCERYLADLVPHITRMGMETRVYASRIREEETATRGLQISPMQRRGILADGQYPPKTGHKPASVTEQNVLTLSPFFKATHYQLHAGTYVAAFEAERRSLPSPVRRLFYPLANRLNVRRQRLLRLQKNMLTGPERPSIMAFSRFTALELDRHYPVSSREITVIPHGVNLSRFRPGSPCPNGTTKIGSHGGREPSLLFVAHNFFLKGLHCLLEVLGRLRKSGVEIPLRVAGSGPTGYFKRLAARYGIRSQVAFLGPMAQNDLVHLYRKSSVLVHPTFYDPCSLVVVEALASGCPVVTTRKNGASELFTSGREGIILDDPGDLGAMADTLLMLRDPRTLREMSQAALDLAPCLDVEKHMFEVMKWLGIERQAEAKG